jgi:hypothetical protein
VQKLPLKVFQGKTFSRVIRWETEPFVYKAITGITQAAPVRLTVVGHGIPDGWRAAVVSVRGMRQINAENDPPEETDFHRATVVDEDTVELNDVNASEFSAYTSGGYLQFYTPKDLTGCIVRLTIRNRAGGAALLELTSPTGIEVDAASKTITVTIDADVTAAFDFTSGVYEIEAEDGDGIVTGLYYGNVTVSKEVAT